jgi:1-acyl-sn-glycerol-3-phosphate acyltransferase
MMTKAARSLNEASLSYRLLYKYARFVFKLFYTQLVIKDLENVPSDKPLIFASNHQNALMDALAMLFAANRPVFFLARADLFKRPFIARILTFLKIMPVFRPRDQVDIVSENKEVFHETARLISLGQPMGILPEGTYTPDKRLQTLKKGICRMAFEAAEATGFAMDLHIVPTGLDYSDYHRQGSDLLIKFGKPIKVADYYDLYKSNPNRALTVLRDTLADSIRNLMINIDIPEEYVFIYNYSQEKTNKYLDEHHFRDKEARLTERFNKMKQESERLKLIYRNDIDAYLQLKTSRPDLQDKIVKCEPKVSVIKKPGNVFSVLITLLALVLNFLPFILSKHFSSGVKDPQFVGTMKYGTSLVLFPIWYLLLLLILIPVFGFIAGLSVVILAIVTAVLYLKYS